MSVSTSTAKLFETGSQNRSLWICVAGSIAFHSLLLVLFPSHRTTDKPKEPPLPVITAIIASRPMAPPPVIEPAPQAAPRPPEPLKPPPQVKPTPEPPRPALSRPTPDSSAPRVQQETPAPTPPVQAAPPPPPPAPPQTANVAPTPPPSVRAPENAAVPAAPPTTDADAGSLSQYRLALIGAARQFKRYPAQAMEKGWTGTVEVRVVVAATGFPRSTTVKTSSGYQVLDLQALDMVRRAYGRARVPPGLQGREFTVDIPVIFDLQSG